MRHPFFETDGMPLAMSHAGDASAGAKAGSLRAYMLAHETGFRFFQVDVVALNNGELIASHAITGRKRKWEASSAEQITSVGHPVHTVDQVLDAVPDSRWNIEIKSDFATDALISLLERRPEGLGRFLISSPFRPSILRRLRDHFGDEIAIAASLIDGGLLGFPFRPGGQRADAVQLWKPLVRSQWMIDRNEDNGVSVQIWSVNKSHRMTYWLDRNVSGLITDNHEGLRDCLMARKQWSHA